MRVLSLDTTTRLGSAALVEDDRIVEVRCGDPSRSHAERLPGDLLSLVDAHGLTFGDIDLFAVAAGPGSFTGLRIGIATIQGLAFTCGRRVVAVPALQALAQSARLQRAESRGGTEPRTGNLEPGTWNREPGTWNLEPGTVLVSWIDAHRHEVFGEAFRIADGPPFEAEYLNAIDAIRVGPPAALLDDLREAVSGAAPIFAGDGALLYAADILRAFPAAHIAEASPIAGAIGLMAVAAARRGRTIDPAAIQPLYVRRPDAVIAREAGR